MNSYTKKLKFIQKTTKNPKPAWIQSTSKFFWEKVKSQLLELHGLLEILLSTLERWLVVFLVVLLKTKTNSAEKPTSQL